MPRRPLGRLKGEDLRWEDAEEEDAHAVFMKWADMVRDRPAYQERKKRNLLYASLYSNLPLLGFGVNNYTRNVAGQGRISLNVTQNAIDSLVSKVCKNRPRPQFTTVEGDFELREKVENADKHIDGRFMQDGYYNTVHPGRILDTAIYGLGATKVHAVDGDGVVERTFPFELLFDDRECMYGNPSRMGHRKYYGKQEAFDLYRQDGEDDSEWNLELERAIDGGGGDGHDEDDFDRDDSSDQIPIFEGWRLPTAKRKGNQIVCVRGKTIVFRDYNEKEFPFNFLRPETQSMGFYGIGFAEKIAPIQGEINRMVRDIQMAMHLVAKPHWMVEASSMVRPESLNNDIATIIKYSGATPPQVYVPQAMSAEVYQHLQFLYRAAYEVSGISQLSAQSQKPSGINSAVGLRTFLNVETERFNDFVRYSEECAAKDAWKLAKVIGSVKSKRAVVWRGKTAGVQSIERVTWAPLDMDSIAVQVHPSSKLPDTPAGKREYALELAQYTKMSTDDIYEMLEWADTESFAKRRLAGRRNVERDFMKMRKGIKVVRDPIGNHQAAYEFALDAYEEAIGDEVPQPRLAMMRNYIKALEKFIAKGKPPPMPPAPMMPPPVGPMPPPGMAPPPPPPMMGPGGGLPPPLPPEAA